MKIEISERIETIREIEVDIPYYYKQFLGDYGDYGDNDSTIYGRITEKEVVTIHEYDNGNKYELEREFHSSIKNSGLAYYLKKENKSSIEEFNDAKQNALNFLNSII